MPTDDNKTPVYSEDGYVRRVGNGPVHVLCGTTAMDRSGCSDCALYPRTWSRHQCDCLFESRKPTQQRRHAHLREIYVTRGPR